jgi:DNA-binding transcriptional ArsR family regulator
MSAEPRARTRRRAAVFAALGDERRLALLTRLSSGPPQSISRLAERSGLTRQGLTRHLRTLEDAGLIKSRRIGRESVFEVRPEPLTDLRDYLDKVSAQWDSALERLRQFVE